MEDAEASALASLVPPPPVVVVVLLDRFRGCEVAATAAAAAAAEVTKSAEVTVEVAAPKWMGFVGKAATGMCLL